MIGLNVDIGKVTGDLLGGLAGAAGGAGGLLSAAGKLDPTSMVVDALGKSLGLPPEVCGAAKLALGIASGNMLAVASGSGDLLGAVAKDLPAMTEHFSGTLNAGIDAKGNGYANLDLQGKYGGLTANFIGRPLLGLDIFKDKLGFPPAPPRPQPPPGHGITPVPDGNGHVPTPVVGGGGGGGFVDGVRYDPRSPLDPNIVKYRDAVETLAANFATFETADGARGSNITRQDLRNIASNPNASPKLKEAAQFLLDNPEYFNRLEMAANVGGKDGIIGMLDLKHESARVSRDIARYGVPPPKGSEPPAVTQPSPGSGSPSPVQTKEPGKVGGDTGINGILNDPTLSIEEKIMLILQKIMDDTDGEIINAMGDLDAQRADHAKASGKDSKADPEEIQRKQSAMEKTQLRLQNLLEKRKRMFDLMTTMSTKFHEMAKGAIQNMARA